MMQKIKYLLIRYKKIGLLVLLGTGFAGYLLHLFYPLTPPLYIERQYRMPIVHLLLVYKIIELCVFYIVFYQKPYKKLIQTQFHTYYEECFKIKAKRFFFLVPQGSIVFGMISYKLSADIRYLWLFLCIALVALLIVNPKRLAES